MSLTVPNLNRIRSTADTTVADALQQTAQYVNRNVPQAAGTRRAAPSNKTHPITPTGKN